MGQAVRRAMTFAPRPSLFGDCAVPTARERVAHEIAPHVRRRHERQHPRGSGRAAGQADRGFQRPVHPHGGVGPPLVHGGLGWKSVGLLELTALPTIGEERWAPWVRQADVLLVDGGDATYLGHWMRE